MKIKKSTIIRTAVMLLSIVNLGLELMGKSPLPFDSAQLTEGISYCWTVAMTLIVWWKDNPITKESILANGIMKELKQSRKAVGGETAGDSDVEHEVDDPKEKEKK